MKKKALCVCIGGTVRSVGIADVLKGTYNYDAIAASAIWNPDDTMNMLCTWADVVIPVEPAALPKGPDQYRHQWMSCVMWSGKYDDKRVVLDVGPDIWANARKPDLREKILALLKTSGIPGTA